MKKNTLKKTNKRLRVLTWHIHGSYLYYLTHADVDFYLPTKKNPGSGYYGKTENFAWGENVHEIPAEEVKYTDFDIILFQSNFSPHNPAHDYLAEQKEILSEKQVCTTPKIFLEHDPPRDHPTDTKHIIDDPTILLVHVTHFNQLMWDNGQSPIVVIEHGVAMPDAHYTGELERGVVMVNNIASRGRRLGFDVFQQIRKHIPLDLIGMGSKEIGGLGEIPHHVLPAFLSQYRFFFNPIRYTSLGLSILEAMMIGLPIIGLATTEMPTTITNGVSGYTHTDTKVLIQKMRYLLDHKEEAQRLSAGARQTAFDRFHITRFAKDWNKVFTLVTEKVSSSPLQQPFSPLL